VLNKNFPVEAFFSPLDDAFGSSLPPFLLCLSRQKNVITPRRMFASTSYSSSGACSRPTPRRREATKKQRRANSTSRRTVRGGSVFPRASAREDDDEEDGEEGEEMEKNPFNIFQPANASTDETVVGAEGVPQFIIEAERKAVPLRRPRLATYAIASSVAAAQLVYILQQSSSLESPILAAASDVCVMIVGSLLWREELRGRAKRLKRIWKEAKERETAMTRAEQGLGETVWTARMRNVNKSFSSSSSGGGGGGSSRDGGDSSGGKNKTSTTDEQQTMIEKDYYPTGVTVSELKQSDKQRRVVEVNGKKVLLQYFMDELYCVSNKCPHLGISMQGKTALLSAGLEEPKREGSKAPCIVCPAHQTAFDMESGEVEGEWCPKLPGKGVPVLGKALEKERKPIEVFKTKVEEMTGSILVAVP
jgi:nitrite reductase/ring-hydroxylating ferredoxin subunit